MIVKTVEGNLISSYLSKTDNTITDMAHGCNCFHAMAAGIAAEVAKRIPAAYKADLETLYGDDHKLGRFSHAYTHTKDGVGAGSSGVFNLYTQFVTGPDARYNSVKQCFEALDAHFAADKKSRHKIGIPLIGCGIGGLDWQIVEHIINSVTPNIDIVVYQFKP